MQHDAWRFGAHTRHVGRLLVGNLPEGFLDNVDRRAHIEQAGNITLGEMENGHALQQDYFTAEGADA
jgi:hypothetical protein